ncbi:hypothetical protein C8R43DRAFT_381018 [Mycena crocata]|nr:hypothetical protein C8R43DRAFT_381018 [Mycena crocata]
MPSIESHSSRSSDSHARSPRSIQPKYYPNRAHQCRYPVLVANIPRHICWQELKDFGRLAGGLVAYCDLDRNKNGRGFIEYLSREDAEEAVRTLNGQKLGGRPVRVLAHSKDPRRSSRSRSPMRRSSRQTHNTQTDDESANGPSYYGSHYAFPMVTPGYSQQSSPKPSSSPDIITSTLYSNDPALPAVLPSNLHAFSKTVNSYRTGLFSEIVAQGSAFMLQTSSYPDSSQPVEPPAVAETLLINDSYDFDGYMRLSYERSRMAGCYS